MNKAAKMPFYETANCLPFYLLLISLNLSQYSAFSITFFFFLFNFLNLE